jgi:hypothetical protein
MTVLDGIGILVPKPGVTDSDDEHRNFWADIVHYHYGDRIEMVLETNNSPSLTFPVLYYHCSTPQKPRSNKGT